MGDPLIRTSHDTVNLNQNVFVGVKEASIKGNHASHDFVIYNNKVGEGIFAKAADKANNLYNFLIKSEENSQLRFETLQATSIIDVANAFFEGVKATLEDPKVKNLDKVQLQVALTKASKIADNTLRAQFKSIDQTEISQSSQTQEREIKSRSGVIQNLESAFYIAKDNLDTIEEKQKQNQEALSAVLESEKLSELNQLLPKESEINGIINVKDKEKVLTFLTSLQKKLDSFKEAFTTTQNKAIAQNLNQKISEGIKEIEENTKDPGRVLLGLSNHTKKAHKEITAIIKDHKPQKDLEVGRQKFDSEFVIAAQKYAVLDNDLNKAKALHQSLIDNYHEKDLLEKLKADLHGKNNLLKALDVDNKLMEMQMTVANQENELDQLLRNYRDSTFTSFSDYYSEDDTISQTSEDISLDEESLPVTGNDALDRAAACVALGCKPQLSNALLSLLKGHIDNFKGFEVTSETVKLMFDSEIEIKIDDQTKMKFEKEVSIEFGKTKEEDKSTYFKFMSGAIVTQRNDTYNKGLALSMEGASVKLIANKDVRLTPTKTLSKIY